MRRLWNTFLKGLVALLPVTLTVYLVWWLGSTAERILSGPLRALLPEDRYWPGLGLVVGFLLVLLVGVMVNAYVVLWRFGAAQLIGFVTEENVHARLFGENADGLVAVYFPMSYQIGGYTLYLPAAELTETDLSVQEAMRLVLIGGVTSHPAQPVAAR